VPLVDGHGAVEIGAAGVRRLDVDIADLDHAFRMLGHGSAEDACQHLRSEAYADIGFP